MTDNDMIEFVGELLQVPNARELGCSIIPDCIDDKDGHMYVVISCLYEEE